MIHSNEDYGRRVLWKVFGFVFLNGQGCMSTTSTARTSKSQAPTSTLILKGWEEEAGTRMQRWWRLCGKEGHPSRAETFGGGQPEATCKRTREIKHLTSSVLLPSSSLPSWETDQKPEGKEAWWQALQVSPQFCSKKVESRPGSFWVSQWSRWPLFSSSHYLVFGRHCQHSLWMTNTWGGEVWRLGGTGRGGAGA